MNLGRIFAHAIARRVAYVVVAAALAWFGIGPANAQSPAPREQAYQHCMADKAKTEAFWAATGFPGEFGSDTCSDATVSQGGYRCTASQTQYMGMGQCVHDFVVQGAPGCTSKACPTAYHGAFPISSDCPSDKPWNPVTKTCFDASQCASKPALGPTFTGGSMAPVTCVDGCKFSAPGNACVSTSTGSACVLTGAKPTGQACSVGDAPPIKDKPQQCTPNGEVCIKPDGQHCMAASTGRQVCWRPGETGVKNDRNVQQKRDAGTTPVPPNLQLPSGDNLQASGPPIQSTTTTNNTTITTVTQNYQTQHGTNAGSTSEGESGTGDGTGKEGDGDGKGTATGGQNCEAAPVTTGDPVLGMVANQAWATRCAVEAGNAAKVTGDVGNCAQPFSVEGTNANAQQLRAMRAQICKGDANGDGQPDWTKPDGTEAGDGGDDDEPGILARMVNTDMLDTSGFLGGGSQCPQLGSLEFGPFGEFNLDSQPYFCDLIALMRGVVLLMGVFLSLRILTGDVI